MSVELEKLKQMRKNVRSSVTRIVTYIGKIDRQNVDVTGLKLRLKILEEARIKFQSVQAEIGVLDKELVPENYEKELDEFENRYYDIATQAEQIIKETEEREARSMSQANTSSASELHVTSNQLNSQVRLPKIDLPVFEGAYENWQSFYSTFKSLIHENTTLNNIQKFHYLKSALKGEAIEIIRSIEINEENYKDAWLRLKERYDNKKLAVQNHIRAIFELPIMKRENVVILRQILDGVEKRIRALKALSRPTENWDDLIIYIVTNKLDVSTIKAWENGLQASELPTYKQLTDFLSKRCQTLEAVAKQAQITNVTKLSIPGKVTTTYAATTKIHCSYCNNDHHIFYCDKFQKLSAFQRTKEAKARGLCLNCLRKNHQAKACISGTCKICDGKHNTMLHIKNNTKDKHNNNNNENGENKQNETIQGNINQEASANVSLHNFSSRNVNDSGHVLLSTAIVKVKDRNGQYHNCRVLLDNGSQSNFITEEFADQLHLKESNINIAIKGINQAVTKAAKSINVDIQSRFDSFQTKIQSIILPNITQNLPLVDLNRRQFHIPQNIRLADPSFHRSCKIDMLIGSEKFWHLICVGQFSLGKGQPILQKTVLGWIVAGGTHSNTKQVKQIHCNFVSTENLNELVHKFWQIEDIPDGNKLSTEEIYCEESFKSSHARTDSGRYIVKLPVNEQLINNLGESKETALKRFYSLERSLNKNPARRIEYVKFMNDYEKLGHMRRVSYIESEDKIEFFLPHHAVMKESSETTKLRVVFDASSKGSTGLSLNDVLYKGPIIQPDIFTILLRFRGFKYVLCADIEKMYRQVLVSDQQTSLQRILWRNSSQDEIQIFELLTLTYGTKPASFLAIRVLHQLAEDEKATFPNASEVLRRDFYVDDLLTGANSHDDLMCLKDELIALLKRGGFILHKWITNIQETSDETLDKNNESIHLDKTKESKLLGILWNHKRDVFHYTSSSYDNQIRVTKRTMLSEVSRIFDPLGLVGPVIVAAKILIQKIWYLKLNWDDSVPVHIHKDWTKLKAQLPMLNAIHIPRRISIDTAKTTQIHGFSDASQQAYGACVYIRQVTDKNEIKVNLICAKSRVAPIKVITLPRLELCGAVLLTKLVRKVISCLDFDVNNVFYWTDSKIVLAWLNAPARRWQTFVANRISEIQSNSSVSNWRHVISKNNPADVISRGLTPAELLKNTSWWEGPAWMKLEETDWPSEGDDLPITVVPESRKETCIFVNIKHEEFELFHKYSSLSKLIRITAYIIRFYNNVKSKNNRKSGKLEIVELENASLTLIRVVQANEFKDDIRNLCKGESVSRRSKLLDLNPFIDDKNILRVGGRLKHAAFPIGAIHPIILPAKHVLARLLIQDEHRMLMHAGTQGTLASLRRKYWFIAGKSAVRKFIRSCVICCKAKPLTNPPLMGQLPAPRVNVARPFFNTGVDFCGPFFVRERVKRNGKTHKAYVAVFVCMAVKAVHLELVEELTTNAFLAAFKGSYLAAERFQICILITPPISSVLTESCNAFSMNLNIKMQS